jgi:hypothetical protein
LSQYLSLFNFLAVSNKVIENTFKIAFLCKVQARKEKVTGRFVAFRGGKSGQHRAPHRLTGGVSEAVRKHRKCHRELLPAIAERRVAGKGENVR